MVVITAQLAVRMKPWPSIFSSPRSVASILSSRPSRSCSTSAAH